MHDPEYLNFLQQFLTPERRARFEEVLDFRTRSLTVVLESLYQSNNASACLRSCDAFGVQDVHVIANENEYRINEEIDMGASYWLTLQEYPPGEQATRDCLLTLKSRGYQIVVTSLQHDAETPDTLPLERPSAIVMGGERPGVSQTAVELADHFLKVPLVGFVQSLNVSVATAIILEKLAHRIRTERSDWNLSEEEKSALRDEWTVKSVQRQHPRVAETFLRTRDS